MDVYLFLPKNASPPYQTVVFFPGSGALRIRSSNAPQSFFQGLPAFDFIIRSGRAVLFPVYKSTFERGDGLLSDRPNPSSTFRDHVIHWVKDLQPLH